MAISHAESGDLIDISPLGAELAHAKSSTLIRAEHLEVFRMVLPAGKVLQPHSAAGAITIQCLEGTIELDAHGHTRTLKAGSLVYLRDAEPHSVRALEFTSLLITILLNRH